MKRLVAAGGFLALALTAFAQTTDDQKVMVPASKEAPPKRLYTSPDEFGKYKGSYSLSNGKTLYLTRKATRMYAQVDEQTRREIVRIGSSKFNSLDGTMAMDIVWSNGDAGGELTYLDESPAVAGLPPKFVTIRFAAQ